MKKLLLVFNILLFSIGVFVMLVGIGGLIFTYNSVVKENITTPNDAYIPGVLVSGPLTLKSQADIIRVHTLRATEGKTFAQMPSKIAKIDENGLPVVDVDGNPVMVANEKRDIWITAFALMNALNIGIMAYLVSGLMILLGFALIISSIIFRLAGV